jgi:hypothetical protein
LAIELLDKVVAPAFQMAVAHGGGFLMKTNFKGLVALAPFAMLALTFTPQAFATAELKITDGTNTVDIVDNGTATCTGAVTGCADANSGTNAVTFVGTIGTWTLNVDTGASHGAAAGTDLDLHSLNSTSAASTLTVSFSDDGFDTPASHDFSVGGTISGPGTVSFSEYAGANKFDQTNQIGSTLTFTSASFSGGTSSPLIAGAALTEVAVFAFTGAGSTSSDAALTPVPEPTSVALFGGALLFIGSALRRRIRRA